MSNNHEAPARYLAALVELIWPAESRLEIDDWKTGSDDIDELLEELRRLGGERPPDEYTFALLFTVAHHLALHFGLPGSVIDRLGKLTSLGLAMLSEEGQREVMGIRAALRGD